MIKACIFDLDGTVANTLNSIAYFANNALNASGLPSIDTEEYKYLVGNGAKTLVERMIDRVGADEGIFPTVFEKYNKDYDNDFLYLTEPYEGIIDMLRAIKEKGIKTAILSNKPHITTVKISDTLFKDELIDVCYGAREGTPLKPDPTALLGILNELGIKRDECVYVGDTGTDMKTGKNTDVYTVGVLWGFRKKDELLKNGADAVISYPSELINIIDKLS